MDKHRGAPVTRRFVRQTFGGSDSRSKWRCVARPSMSALAPAAAESLVMSPGVTTSGSRAGPGPAARSSETPAPSARMGLQWRYWSLMNS